MYYVSHTARFVTKFILSLHSCRYILCSFCPICVRLSNSTPPSSSPPSFPPAFPPVQPFHMSIWTVNDLVTPMVHCTWHDHLPSKHRLIVCRQIMRVITTLQYEGTYPGAHLKQCVVTFEAKTFENAESRNDYLDTIATRLTTLEQYLQRNQTDIFQFIEQTLNSDSRMSEPQPSGRDAEQSARSAQGSNVGEVAVNSNKTMLDNLLNLASLSDQELQHNTVNQSTVMHSPPEFIPSSSGVGSTANEQQQDERHNGRNQNELRSFARSERLNTLTEPVNDGARLLTVNWRDHLSRDERVKICRYIMTKLGSLYSNVSEDSLKQRTRSFEAKTFQSSKSREDYLNTIAKCLTKVEEHFNERNHSAPKTQTNSH